MQNRRFIHLVGWERERREGKGGKEKGESGRKGEREKKNWGFQRELGTSGKFYLLKKLSSHCIS